MKLQDLIPGTLIKRYKRFLADIKLDNGETITAHCPNSGSMKGCNIPGSRVYVSRSDNPKRKLKFTWEMVETDGVWIGINTFRTNSIAASVIREGKIQEFENFDSLKAEVPFGENSRVDFVLEKDGGKIYVEVKNVSLVENRRALFPDAVTTRGQKHLRELMHMIENGHSAAMLYIIQRNDADCFAAAREIDPQYARLLNESHQAGVEIIPLVFDIHVHGIDYLRRVPWNPD